jgi:hypothetical protein
LNHFTVPVSFITSLFLATKTNESIEGIEKLLTEKGGRTE